MDTFRHGKFVYFQIAHKIHSNVIVENIHASFCLLLHCLWTTAFIDKNYINFMLPSIFLCVCEILFTKELLCFVFLKNRQYFLPVRSRENGHFLGKEKLAWSMRGPPESWYCAVFYPYIVHIGVSTFIKLIRFGHIFTFFPSVLKFNKYLDF